MKTQMLRELIVAIVEMQENEAVALAERLLEDQVNPLEVLDACRGGMTIIGNRFEKGESFIPELIMGGEILAQISEVLKPYLSGEVERQKVGKVVIGTVQGDIHDIAKDIVVFMLDINGFEVYDLGVDVPPGVFVDKVIELNATVLGLSGFLTMAIEPMKETVSALSQAGVRDNVKVMIGGGPIDEHVEQYTGADAWGRDAMAAVKIARDWIGEGG
jgi:5-methyltetrahydrofolate--homocysteine methyltransferase